MFDKPFYDESEDHFIVRLRAIEAFFETKNFKIERQTLIKQLKELGSSAPDAPIRIRGKNIRVWRVPNRFETYIGTPEPPKLIESPI